MTLDTKYACLLGRPGTGGLLPFVDGGDCLAGIYHWCGLFVAFLDIESIFYNIDSNPLAQSPLAKMCFQGGLGDFLKLLNQTSDEHSSAKQLIFYIHDDCIIADLTLELTRD